MDFETIFLRTIRVAPEWFEGDDAAFIARTYADVLGREPEFDPSERVAALPPGDRHGSRTAYLGAVLSSEESRRRGHEAMIAVLTALIAGQRRELAAELLRTRYATIDALTGGLDRLMAHLCDNSRRQDRILALASA